MGCCNHEQKTEAQKAEGCCGGQNHSHSHKAEGCCGNPVSKFFKKIFGGKKQGCCGEGHSHGHTH